MKDLKVLTAHLLATVRSAAWVEARQQKNKEAANLQKIEVNKLIQNIERTIVSAKFAVLAEADFWNVEEDEIMVYPLQYFAALQIFQKFFVGDRKDAWVHLAALMQAGKTGVIQALLKLLEKNRRALNIPFSRCFITTGMSDNAWRQQTEASMPDSRALTVEHSGGLANVQAKLRGIRKEEYLSNIFIVLDESHIACQENNRPSSVLDTVKELCPPALWVEKNIRILTISATDPARFIDIQRDRPLVRSSIVKLDVTAEQQTIEQLEAEGRLVALEDLGGDLHEEVVMDKVVDFMKGFQNTPRQHFFRPRVTRKSVKTGGKSAFDRVKELLDARKIKQHVCDSHSKPEPKAKAETDSISSSQDINNLLKEAPEEHTVILIRNMFYAAKRLHDEQAGIFFDRIGFKDDTNLQSLLGRSCGQGKSRDTVIFCSKRTIENYKTCWKGAMAANANFDPDAVDADKLGGRMSGITVCETGLATIAAVAVPGGEDGGYVAPAPPPKDEQLISPTHFNKGVDAKAWATANLTQGNSMFQIYEKDGTKFFKQRGKERAIKTEEATRADTDLAQGVASSARVMPVQVGTQIKQIVIQQASKRK